VKEFILNLSLIASLSAASLVITDAALERWHKDWLNVLLIRVWDWLDDQKPSRLLRSYRSRLVQTIIIVVVCGLLGYEAKESSVPYFGRISIGVVAGSLVGIPIVSGVFARWITAKEGALSLMFRSILVALGVFIATSIIAGIAQALAGVASIEDESAPPWFAFAFGLGFGIISVPVFYCLITIVALFAIYPLSVLLRIFAFVLRRLLDHPKGALGVSTVVGAIASLLKWGAA
jgi:hypothetical protein